MDQEIRIRCEDCDFIYLTPVSQVLSPSQTLHSLSFHTHQAVLTFQLLTFILSLESRRMSYHLTGKLLHTQRRAERRA